MMNVFLNLLLLLSLLGCAWILHVFAGKIWDMIEYQTTQEVNREIHYDTDKSVQNNTGRRHGSFRKHLRTGMSFRLPQ